MARGGRSKGSGGGGGGGSSRGDDDDDPTTTREEVDAYGFTLLLDADGVKTRERCAATAAKRSPRWDRYRRAGDAAFSDVTHRPNGLLKTLIRKGVPADLRPEVWMATSGAAAKKKVAPRAYYKRLQALPVHQTVRDQVDIDLGRTFPENSRYNDNEEAQETLRRVLLAYARHNPGTGYCQGMNYIGAFLWLVMGDEESVFWVFVCLLDDICQPAVHAPDIRGTMSEYKVLHRLLAAREPKLQAHFEKTEVDLVMIASKWLLCFLTESFPAETAARVLDAVFSEGFKVWFRVVIAMLKMHEAELLRSDMLPDTMRALQVAFRDAHDRDALMRFAFKRLKVFPRATVEKHRAEVAAETKREQQDRAEKEKERILQAERLKADKEKEKEKQRRGGGSGGGSGGGDGGEGSRGGGGSGGGSGSGSGEVAKRTNSSRKR